MALPSYCPVPGAKDGDVLTALIKMYDQCTTDYTTAAIRYEIKPKDQVGGSGVTFSDTSENTPITTAASLKPGQFLFGGRELKWTANVQSNAFSKQLDELCYGTTFEPADDRTGWSQMALSDQVGVALPRYCVVISYYRGTSIFAEDWIPAAEIMVEGGANMAAGVIYNRQVVIMAQVAAVPGFPDDTRAVRYFKD